MNIPYSRVGAALAALVAGAAIEVSACSQGAEGDRCNPDLAAGESECNGGLRCGVPPLCPEAYCCPPADDGGLASSRNPNCQTGCNGGAASICNSGQDDAGACAFACRTDPSDLTGAALCGGPDAAEAGARVDAPDDAATRTEAGAGAAASGDGGRG